MFINQDQVQSGYAMLNMGFPPIDAAMDDGQSYQVPQFQLTVNGLP